MPLGSLDGIHLLTSKEDVVNRWAEHFNALLRSADLQYISLMPQLHVVTELTKPVSRDEVVAAMKQHQNKGAVGVDLISGELI